VDNRPEAQKHDPLTDGTADQGKHGDAWTPEAVELVVDKFKRELENQEKRDELLKKLDWNDEKADEFVSKWESQIQKLRKAIEKDVKIRAEQEKAGTAEQGQGLSGETRARRVQGKDFRDSVEKLYEGRKAPVPSHLRELWELYNKAYAEDPEEKR